jgi:hypothetical protein
VTVKNLAASVHARLQNRARAEKRPFQELLQYYAMERFLYRLSMSSYRERFILKGALMLHVWQAPLSRATKDVDLLGRFDNSLESMTRAVREMCETDVEPDGMLFDPGTVRAQRIKEDADYEGVRVRFVGFLGKAQAPMQIDVGFGDVVTPGSEKITYPSLLDFPAAKLAGYTRETVVAEKFHAMVYLRTANTRMKDFHDVWLLAKHFPFDGQILAKAVSATFAHRDTVIDVNPIAFTPEFTEQATTVAQWTAFRSRLAIDAVPEHLPVIIEALVDFLLPVARACQGAGVAPFTERWLPGGPWIPSS